MDQLFVVCRTNLRQKIWWWSTFTYLLDASLVNAWIFIRFKIINLLNKFNSTNIIKMSVSNDPQQVDEEMTIPRAAMNKMIKEILPNVRVAIEARELILQCCTEFIHLLSSESNEICNKQQKKTINAEHILMSLDNLGFGDYRTDAEAVVRDCKAVAAKKRRKNTRLENLGIPEEELLRQQQELFAKAREEQLLADQQMMLQMQAQMAIVNQQEPKDSNDMDEDYS